MKEITGVKFHERAAHVLSQSLQPSSIGVSLIESAETRRNLSFEEIVGEERWTLMISPSTS